MTCSKPSARKIGVTWVTVISLLQFGQISMVGTTEKASLYQNSQTLTHPAGVLPGHPLQKRTQIQWDIGAALGTGNGADESTSPQAGISHLGPIYVGTIIYVVGAL